MSPTRQNIADWARYHELFAYGFLNEALGTVAELGVADALGDEPMAAKDLARALGLDSGALYRALRALAAYGIFEEMADKKFRHNSFSTLLRKDHPYSLQGMAELWHSVPLRRAWGHFGEALRDGRSAF